jgi:hypothetical protein
MRDTVEQDVVREDNLRAVDPSRTIRQHSEDQIRALQRRNSDIAQARREDDAAGDDVVLEHFLEGRQFRSLKHRPDVLERLVGGHENGEIGDVERRSFFAEAKIEVQVCGSERGIHGEVARAVGEELEWGAEGEDGVDLVDCDAFAEFDVLFVC